MIEIVGYLASALIVLSLAMTSVVRLRIISLIGSVTFVIYGALISSVPVIITNSAVAALNIWFLYKEFTKRNLAMVPIETNAPFLADFLAAQAADIARIQPDFTLRPDAKAWLLTRDSLPAGAFIGRISDNAFHVDLDYVTPAYRDSRMGEFVYGEGAKTLRDLGVTYVVAHPGAPEHRRYLESMHFVPAGDELTRRIA